MPDRPAESVALLLASMFRDRHSSRRRSSFAFNSPGRQVFARGGGVAEINYDSKLLLRSALHIRKHASHHLKSMPIHEIESLLQDFITENYYLIANESFGNFFKSSFHEHLSSSAKCALVAALATSVFFVAPRLFTLFPLVPIVVESEFSSVPFFIGPPASLAAQTIASSISDVLVPNSFPPIRDWEGIRHSPTSWLGVHSPSIGSAKQMRAAILGGIALLPHHLERYAFSGRAMFGGHISLQNGLSFSTGEPNTPALMTNLTISESDHVWLELLAQKLVSDLVVDKRQMRALEYYYRAWAPDPVKRFPTLFAALDAIFGDAGQATQSVVDAVNPVMGALYTHDRIRLMLGLRASVIHGGAPNVYESRKYGAYYEAYETDPTRDLELIVARCLQSIIFPAVIHERPHTYAELVKTETGIDI